MTRTGSPRVVYSTEGGRTCHRCGWPVDRCACAAAPRSGSEPVPEKIIAKLRLEKQGRGGKTVTVIDGLPDHANLLAALAQELKRACGTGGAVRRGALELQGDRREQVRELLGKKGYAVKG